MMKSVIIHSIILITSHYSIIILIMMDLSDLISIVHQLDVSKFSF